MVALSKQALKRFRGRFDALGIIDPQGEEVPHTVALIPQAESLGRGKSRRFEKLVGFKRKAQKEWDWVHRDFRK